MPTRTLDALLDETGLPQIDFITIDVEGHEMDVLQGLSLEKHRPRVVIFEENVGRRTSDVAAPGSTRIRPLQADGSQ